MTRRSPAETSSGRHFDDVADTWVARYETAPSFRTRLRVVAKTAAGLLDPGGAARVVDLGGGPGVLGTAVSASAEIVVCVDTSWAMLHAGLLAQRQIDALLDDLSMDHRSDVVVRVTGSMSALAGAQRKPFDLGLAISVLEYQTDPERLLIGLVGMVRPGGHILFTVPNQRSIVRIVERPIDAVAARAGRMLGRARLSDRSYSSTRPFGSAVPWQQALAATGAVCKEVVRLPLGDAGARHALHPNLLVVAQVP